MAVQNKKESLYSRALMTIVTALFVSHFALVIVYQFGRSTFPSFIVEMADRYNIPWFYQNYMMFAPDPTHHINTFVYQVEQKGEWSTWYNPVFGFQQDHWSNRFGSGSDMYDMLNGVADALYNAAQYRTFAENAADVDLTSLPGLMMAKKYVLRCTPALDEGATHVRIGVLTEQHRIDDSGAVRVMYVFQEFPVLELTDAE